MCLLHKCRDIYMNRLKPDSKPVAECFRKKLVMHCLFTAYAMINMKCPKFKRHPLL